MSTNGWENFTAKCSRNWASFITFLYNNHEFIIDLLIMAKKMHVPFLDFTIILYHSIVESIYLDTPFKIQSSACK